MFEQLELGLRAVKTYELVDEFFDEFKSNGTTAPVSRKAK